MRCWMESEMCEVRCKRYDVRRMKDEVGGER